MSDIQEIKKEFELERMILFSDAVFAIAITLLILEVKFPELHKGMTNAELKIVFKPVLYQFLAFVVSFFFIGAMWAKHLTIFKFLHSYNRTIIVINLFFLFFIVCFPFVASGFSENTNKGMALPWILYIGNITFVSIVKGILGWYLFKKENEITIPGKEEEKKYFYLEGLWTALGMFAIFLLLIIIAIIFPGDAEMIGWPVYLLGFLMFFIRKKLKKYKPKKIRQNINSNTPAV